MGERHKLLLHLLLPCLGMIALAIVLHRIGAPPWLWAWAACSGCFYAGRLSEADMDAMRPLEDKVRYATEDAVLRHAKWLTEHYFPDEDGLEQLIVDVGHDLHRDDSWKRERGERTHG